MDFDANGVRAAWDFAADAYAAGQASGRDYYRYDFFGPAQIEQVGDVRRTKLLDVGCGAGYFAREMAARGATVTAVDISPKMIAHARAAGGAIVYEVLDAVRIGERFAAGSFDLATSCLALQDMPNVPAVLAGIHRTLRPGGRLVASIEHPCSATPFREWERDPSGGKRWLCIDRYFDHAPVEYTWKRWRYEFTTSAMHVPLEVWFGWFRDAGFTLRDLREPRPSDAAVRARPDLEDATRVPYFLLLDLVATAA